MACIRGIAHNTFTEERLMVITIILSLLLLMFIAYKGFPVIVFAPVCALLAASTAGMALLPTYTDLYMGNAVNFIKAMFPIFLLGALFGKLMEVSGAAKSIALWIVDKLGEKHVMLAIVLTTAILVYGGVSLFVVTFTLYPLAASLFKRLEIPKRLIAGAIFFGFATFTYALPGLPQVQNVIPTRYLGTTIFAGGVFGSVFGLLIFVVGMVWLQYRVRQAKEMGEGYGVGHVNEPPDVEVHEELPNPLLCLVPMIVILALNFILTKSIPNWSPSMLEGFPHLTLKDQAPTWALILSLLSGIFLILIIGRKRLNTSITIADALTAGAVGSLLAIFNTAAEVGYGNVISKLPGFRVVADFLLRLDPFGSPLFPEFITINIMAGITGSASGGMVIAFEAMGGRFIEWANATGISMEMLHRTAVMAACGLDSLPHNGAVITTLAICGLTHKQAYKDIFVLSVLLPIGSLMIGLIIYSLFFV